mmetsp:Transcript_14419/g.43620  ORF Transcript_14419/g.43620 Transcript_14419/m.43620 type:complete len:483 (-) Transcript_14419:261-1709(-)|eukprot:CAMPEP_0206141290 /NCGR_PEP_ID=MMETSP1473-20131121/12459_1 /ASSEMBLY_ACC=CAM_ASM_001109 /TAXON_ID=1461547 /ORGANISM="Stichococcus sp, Strain RCC1054" /LENGTH=482 /DNA_ID=CAMNT_0053535801 /DNA_START=78 /DNA_END=1526 /DNA_ORIENTATION=+
MSVRGSSRPWSVTGSVAILLPALLLSAVSFPVQAAQQASRSSLGNARGTKADFGFVEVRPGAHMFWTLEPCTGCHHMSILDEPLIIWLQGGPGASSAGYGNYMEIGPYEIGWKPRKHSWAEAANLLFIDNPVGTGWSHVDKHGSFAKDNDEIVDDLMTMFRQWSKDHFEFHTSPVLLFCESYGGKMGAAFAKSIAADQASGQLQINFQGVALGDSWISPTDFLASWGPFLSTWSLLDGAPLQNVTSIAAKAETALNNGKGEESTRGYEMIQDAIKDATDDVDWYNALLHHIPDEDAAMAATALWGTYGDQDHWRHLGRHHPEGLRKWMNHEVKDVIPILPKHAKWGSQSADVFDHLRGDFMSPVITIVDDLLASGVPVTVYEGQLDLICCTLGAQAWMAKLKWPGMKNFNNGTTKPWYVRHHNTQTAGFMREHDNLALITVMGAGHMIPIDQPQAARKMVDMIMKRHAKVSKPSTTPAVAAS